MKDKYIGVYDSGIGGLSIVNSIIQDNPDINIKYIADTKLFPLGDKSAEVILNRMKCVTEYLFDNGCDLVILACNTATVNSIRVLQENLIKSENFKHKNVLGMSALITEDVRDYIKEGNICSVNSKTLINIILLGTKATINSGLYQDELIKLSPNISVLPVACYGLADAIERQKSVYDEEVRKVFTANIEKLSKESGDLTINAIVFACTHYGFAKDNIVNIIRSRFKKNKNNKIQIIDPATNAGLKTKLYLSKQPQYLPQYSNKLEFIQTENKVESIANISKYLLNAKKSNYNITISTIDI